MTTQHFQEANQLEEVIAKAVKKIEATRENDICRYLPMPTGGYIHHFTMRKMRQEEPTKLREMIEEYILQQNKPISVAPKPRAARGSRKRRDQLQFSKIDIETMLSLARSAGNKDIVRKLMPKKDLKTVKRELIVSIRHSQVDEELWQLYRELVTQTTAALAQ
jgi:hypothetical protein